MELPAKLIGALIVLFLLNSCKSAYVPNAQNVPLFQEKGEIKVSVSITNTETGPTDFQAAYALSDHIGIMVNAKKSNKKESADANKINSEHYKEINQVVEAGIGYFGKTNSNLTYEVYGGAGLTKVGLHGISWNSIDNDSRFDADGLKFFVQPTMGFVRSAFDIGFSTRITGLKFNNYTTNYSYEDLEKDRLNKLDAAMHLFAEPAITMRAGYKWIKVQIQTGVSIKMTSTPIPYESFFGGLGLAADIGKWYTN